MIFQIFQIPENFLLGHASETLELTCKFLFYGCAVITSLAHQPITRFLGLRKTLYLGLICNLIGLTLLMINQLFIGKGFIFLVLLDMVLFGIALTSVVNSLITYIILKSPKHVGAQITALFIFFCTGIMLAPILLSGLESYHLGHLIFFLLIALILLSIWLVHRFFFTVPFPTHLEKLRKGTLIWKELHYRLALFVFAIIAYGLTETTFNLWGFVKIRALLGIPIANDIVSLFWICMILGQTFLFFSFHFFPLRRLIYLFVLIIFCASLIFPLQTHLSGFIFSIIIAGFGCSAIFPSLLFMMEKEMLVVIPKPLFLPYIESGVSLMIAGYFTGIATIDIMVYLLGGNPSVNTSFHFHIITACMTVVAVTVIYLNLTRPQKIS